MAARDWRCCSEAVYMISLPSSSSHDCGPSAVGSEKGGGEEAGAQG